MMKRSLLLSFVFFFLAFVAGCGGGYVTNASVDATTPTINWSTPASIVYGTALGDAQLNASSSVAGSFTYSPAAGSVVNAGVQTLTATFTPTDRSKYKESTATVNLTVNKATPTVSAWPTASAINYGQTLASSTLSGGTASVAGTFTWTASSTATAIGANTDFITFTPTNTN